MIRPPPRRKRTDTRFPYPTPFRSQRVHLRGTDACCAEVGRRMAERGRGAIVVIASVAGMRSGPLHSYGPAKAAIVNLAECLAGEWGDRKSTRLNSSH